MSLIYIKLEFNLNNPCAIWLDRNSVSYQALNQSVTDRQTYEICLLFNFQSRRSSTSDKASFQPPIQVLLARASSALGGELLYLHLHHHQVSRRPHFS